MKNVRFALALFAVIALGFVTSAAFADTSIPLRSHKTITVTAADNDGNPVTMAYDFAITSGSDVCTGLQVSPSSGLATNQAAIFTDHLAGTCTLTVSREGTPIKTEVITVPPGPVVSYSTNWQ